MPRRGQAAAQTICRATQDQVAPPAAPPESSRPRTRCRSWHAGQPDRNKQHLRRWHQHRECRVGWRICHHAQRRLSAEREDRLQQLRREGRRLQWRPHSVSHRKSRKRCTRQRLFQGLASRPYEYRALRTVSALQFPVSLLSVGLNRDQNRFNNYGRAFSAGPSGATISSGSSITRPALSPPVQRRKAAYETSQFDSSAAASGSIASKYLSYKGEGAASSGLVQTTCAQVGLVEGVNCATTTGGLDVGSPLKSALGTQDPTYGGSTNHPGVGGGLDGVPDLALFNTVNPTSTSQQQYNGRLDAQVRNNDHLAFAIYWVPSDTTKLSRARAFGEPWHHSQINDAFSVIFGITPSRRHC